MYEKALKANKPRLMTAIAMHTTEDGLVAMDAEAEVHEQDAHAVQGVEQDRPDEQQVEQHEERMVEQGEGAVQRGVAAPARARDHADVGEQVDDQDDAGDAEEQPGPHAEALPVAGTDVGRGGVDRTHRPPFPVPAGSSTAQS